MSQPDQCHSYLQLGSPESRGVWIISTHRLSAACCRFLLCSFSKHGDINSRLVHSPAAECAGDVESQKVWNLTLIFCRTHENNEVFKQRQRTKDSGYGETPKIKNVQPNIIFFTLPVLNAWLVHQWLLLGLQKTRELF